MIHGLLCSSLALSAAPTTCFLDNGLIHATFGARGLTSLESLGVELDVAGDNFLLALDGSDPINSASLPANATRSPNDSQCAFTFTSDSLEVTVSYELREGAHFLSKGLTLRHLGPPKSSRNITEAVPFAGILLSVAGAPPSISKVVSSSFGLGDYTMFLRWTRTMVGALLTAQNPYLSLSASNVSVGVASVAYSPDLMWRSDSPLQLDQALLALYQLSGRTLTAPAPDIDEAEQDAMVAVLRSHIVSDVNRSPTVKINIAWTENDYQLDIALPEDRAAYKRIVDRAAEFGLTHLLFAPQNSDVSNKANNTDAWGWEQILWFGMGQKLRMGEWTPGDPIPDSLREMLDYFKAKKVQPVAYVYPILAFLAGTGANSSSPPWIVEGTYELHDASGHKPSLPLGSGPADNGPLRSCLASPELQDWLTTTMLTFARTLGAGGFSFDYTYFEQNGPYPTFFASQYAQWAGWRRILAGLHADPTACGGSQCVVDNRQQNHAWGPWMWVQGGTYAEPLQSDEQPGSWMFYESDLHTDRLSGNRQREVAWSYRQLEFCPAESLPGFAFHQTDRDASPRQKAICPDGRCSNASRARDFDLLGHRYSLLSSIGTGGLNNVICYLPARDQEEFERLPPEELAFVQRWLSWTDTHTELLKQTRALPGAAARPSFGMVDGTVMIDDDAKQGALFLFNPSSSELIFSVHLNASIGLSCPNVGRGLQIWSSTPLVLEIALSGSSDSQMLPYTIGLVTCGELLQVAVPPTAALVLSLKAWVHDLMDVPLVLGAPLESVVQDASTGLLTLSGVRGEAGTAAVLTVVLPPATSAVSSAIVNGLHVAFHSGTLHGAASITVDGVWGTLPRFGRSQQLCPPASGRGLAPSSGPWKCSFTVPTAVSKQLVARNESFPLDYDLDPASNNEPNVAWLAPGRLLVWVKYRSLLNDMYNVSGTIDGQPLLVRKAYNTIVPSAQRFIGHFVDVTPHIRFGEQQSLSLSLPAPGGWSIRQGALNAGNDVRQLQGTVAEAQAACAENEACVGVTFKKDDGVDDCDAAPTSTGSVKAYLKTTTNGNGDAAWCTIVKPPTLVGVFFDNVETLYTGDLTQPAQALE